MDTVERIKELCKRKGIAISRLEKACGFSNGYIRSLREGTMPADRLFKVAAFLNVSPEYLVSGKYSPKESTEGKVYYFNDETAQIAQEIMENPNLHALFKAARGLPPKDMDITTDLIERLKSTNPDG